MNEGTSRRPIRLFHYSLLCFPISPRHNSWVWRDDISNQSMMDFKNDVLKARDHYRILCLFQNSSSSSSSSVYILHKKTRIITKNQKQKKGDETSKKPPGSPRLSVYL